MKTLSFKSEIKSANSKMKRYAQQVYPSEQEYIKWVQSRLRSDEYVCSGMGSLSISKVVLPLKDEEQKEVETKFAKWLHEFEWDNEKSFPHTLPYMFNKKRIITDKIEKQIKEVREKFKTDNNLSRNEMPSMNYAYMQYLFNGTLSSLIYSHLIKKNTNA